MDRSLSALLRGSADPSDFRAEYDAFARSCALVSRADRAAVRVTGERAAEMLNGLVTNRVTGLDRRGCHALLLNAKGRILSDMRVLPEGAGLLLDVPRAGLDNLLSTFKKYLPPIYASYENLSDDVVQVGVYGPESSAAVAAAIGDVPAEPHLSVLSVTHEGESLLLIRDRRLAEDGIELLLPAAASTAVVGELSKAAAVREGRAAGWRALEARRIERGIPRYGIDMSDANLAQESGLEEEAISYDKGCYLGQEVVARVHFRGHVNRRLMGLKFGEGGAAPGARLFRGEKRVGEVTSSVDSPAFGPIGLGYVRREIEESANLRWSEDERGGELMVTALPFRE
jgi:folate-binding protein YgfZ